MNALNEAIDSLEFNTAKNIINGETIQLNNEVELYRYDVLNEGDADIIVLRYKDEEMYCVLLDNENESLIFEEL